LVDLTSSNPCGLVVPIPTLPPQPPFAMTIKFPEIDAIVAVPREFLTSKAVPGLLFPIPTFPATAKEVPLRLEGSKK
jgi:hypothetical protein